MPARRGLGQLLVRRGACLAAWCLFTLGAAAPAHAGDYRVFMCETPSGANVPTDGLSLGASANGFWYENTCGRSGGIVAVATGLGGHLTAEAAIAQINAPAGTGIAGYRLDREVWTAPLVGSENAIPRWSVYTNARGDHNLTEFCNPGFPGPPLKCTRITRSVGSWTGTPATALIWDVVCAGDFNTACAGSTAEAGPRVTGWVYGIDLTLRDAELPAATGFTVTGATTSAARSAVFSATDRGGGVRDATASVDGKPVATWSAGGTCTDQGNAAETAFDYVKLVPCPLSAPVTIPIDASKLSNGEHALAVTVRDAAGNTSTVAQLPLTVAIPDRPAGPGAGSTAPPGVIRVIDAPKRSVAHGSVRVLHARIVDVGGQPLSGVTVRVSERLRAQLAGWGPAREVTTDAEGGVAISVPTGGSREVKLEYPHAGGTESAIAVVRVRAGMAISPAAQRVPRFGRMRLAGKLAVDGFPKRGAYVDLQLRQGKRWRTIATRRTDAAGRWTWSYRLASGRSATYVFRARLRPAPDLAAAVSSSRTVRVSVR